MPAIRRWAGAIAAFTVLCVASTAHAAFSGLYIFGDSLSDPGNNAIVLNPGVTPPSAITSNFFVPEFPYTPSLQYSNGDVWSHAFAQALGLSAMPVLAGGTNFAFGGARTGPLNPNGLLDPGAFPPSLLTQVATFLGATGGVAPSTALYVIAGGGNNARSALEAIAKDPANALAIIGDASQAYAADVKAMVDSLQQGGATDIIVWNTPNLGLAPAVLSQPAPPPGFPTASQTGTLVSATMNQALAVALAGEDGVTTFDLFGLLTAINANPAAYGFSNATDACGAVPGCAPNDYLFWDGIHPTAAGHRVLANAMLETAAVPEPSTYALLAAGLLLLLVFARRRA
jgi:phospholipase/lecithinase/hemolysin